MKYASPLTILGRLLVYAGALGVCICFWMIVISLCGCGTITQLQEKIDAKVTPHDAEVAPTPSADDGYSKINWSSENYKNAKETKVLRSATCSGGKVRIDCDTLADWNEKIVSDVRVNGILCMVKKKDMRGGKFEWLRRGS